MRTTDGSTITVPTAAASSHATRTQASQQVQIAALTAELELQRVELEARNEELRCVQHQQLELARLQHELFDSAPASYVALNDAGVIVRANAAASALLGLAVRRLVGQRIGTFVAEHSWDVLDQFLSTLRADKRASCKLWLQRWDNQPLLADLEASRMGSSSGESLIMFTKRSTRPREISDGPSQHERLRDLGLLAAGIAHDLNNLLTGVVGGAELALQMPDLSHALREPLSAIWRSARDASALTSQVLGFASSTPRATTATDLRLLIADCLELVRPRVHGELQLTSTLAHDLSAIAADRTQMQRVLLNLLTNAIDAVGEHAGVVSVSARLETLDRDGLRSFCQKCSALPGRFALITVTDSGHGLDAQAKAGLFEPFVTTKAHGHGLGLANVLSIVKSYRGAIRVQSRPGHGTRFEIALPLAGEPTVLTRALVPPTQVPKAPCAGSLLMIDDEPVLCTTVARTLNLLGYEVNTAHDGEQGLALVARSEAHYDAVILDWAMPNMSGAVVLAELRRLRPGLPVVVMSGYGTEHVPPEAESVRWLQKPATLEELRQTLQEAIDKHGVSDA